MSRLGSWKVGLGLRNDIVVGIKCIGKTQIRLIINVRWLLRFVSAMHRTYGP